MKRPANPVHALGTVWGCQAGKDVYVEKPVSHEIWEGRQMIAAARKYQRIVQTGTQSRSDEALQGVFAHIKQGHLGAIQWVRAFCYKRRKSIGRVNGPQAIPKSCDYDLWCGPAERRPLMRERFHYDWHWDWNTGNGDIGNQGIHEMDMVRWALGQDALAPAVLSVGGRFGYQDDGETPNTQIAFFDSQPAPLIFEVRGLPLNRDNGAMPHYRSVRVGLVVQCEGGYFAGGVGGGWTYDNDGKRIQQFKSAGGGGHPANFIKAVRSRKVSDLHADIAEGHLPSSLCHMANISHRLGLTQSFSAIQEEMAGHSEMLDSLQRFQEHLNANDVKLDESPASLGSGLNMDPSSERFVGEKSEWANMLWKRNYREPFIILDQV